MLHRLMLTLITIFFPPLTVFLLTGPYTDTLLNSILFLCGVIPSHIHAFYISCTYFHRKGKVRKGKWPGPPKALIFDKKVWYGGATEREAEELRVRKFDGEEKGKRSSQGTSPSVHDPRWSQASPGTRNRTSGVGYEGAPALPQRRPSRRSWGGVGGGGGGDDVYSRRSEVRGDSYDRRSHHSIAGYDRRSQMSDGLDHQRSVFQEINRHY